MLEKKLIKVRKYFLNKKKNFNQDLILDLDKDISLISTQYIDKLFSVHLLNGLTC